MALISEQGWKLYISGLKSKKKATKEEVKEALVDAIVTRLPKKKKFGIMFSGGVDSSLIALIAKQNNANFICYAVGLQGAADLEAAKLAAKLMKIPLKCKTYTLKEAEKIIKKVTKIVGPDTMKVGVGSVVYAAANLAKKDKITHFLGGLGSEEIFAGYERHLSASDINRECWKGLKDMWKRDLTRDTAIAEKLKIKLGTPFLDHKLIRTAMKIDGKEKINKKFKKIILRKISEELGMPKEVAWRKKQAAQYGSKFDRAIYRLAHRNKFKYKKDYLESL
ncbi:MAG: asparagine synthase-related protein [Candidatus Woesearchaeota archaeon]